MGLLKFLGFSIPFAVALDLAKDPPYDARPNGGRCCLCKRWRGEVYRRGDGQNICRDDLADIVRTSGPRRVTSPRPLGQWPLEKVAESPGELAGDLSWWDARLG